MTVLFCFSLSVTFSRYTIHYLFKYFLCLEHLLLLLPNLPSLVGRIIYLHPGEGHCNPLQYSCLENPVQTYLKLVWFSWVIYFKCLFLLSQSNKFLLYLPGPFQCHFLFKDFSDLNRSLNTFPNYLAIDLYCFYSVPGTFCVTLYGSYHSVLWLFVQLSVSSARLNICPSKSRPMSYF